MGRETRFSEKWDFRRKENDFEDSSSDDPDSNSTRDPIIHNPNVLLDSNQIDNGPKALTREEPVKTRKRRSKKDEIEPVKTRKRRSKKDETKPEKAKQVQRKKPKTGCAEENKKKEEMETGMDGVGMFMEKLLDDLTASRESLMNWMNTELHRALDENVASRPPLKKRGVAAVAAQRSVKKRMTKKMKEEEEKMKKKKEEEEKETEKQSKLVESSRSQEMNTPKEKSSEIAHNGQDLYCNAGQLDRFLESGQGMNTPKEKSPEIAQNGGDFDCTAGPLGRFLKSGQDGLGRNYYLQQLKEDQEAVVTQTEMENSKKETVKSNKDIILAIEAQNLSKKRKKKSEAYTNKNRSSMVERTGPETQKDHNFVTPFASQLSSTSSLQSFPVSSLLFPKLSSSSLLQSFPVHSSLFPSSSQGITPLASNTNFQLRQPVAQIPDLSEFQTGVIGDQLRQPVARTPDLSEFQTGVTGGQLRQPVARAPDLSEFQTGVTGGQLRQPVARTPDLSECQTGVTGGQGFENSLDHNNGYFSGFPAAFQPNLLAGGYNFPPYLNPTTSTQQRDDNNMFGGLRMAGGAIRFSDNRFPEAEVGNCINDLSDYRTSSVDKGLFQRQQQQ